MPLNQDWEHIIWDWNGTLLNDLDLVVEITNGMLFRRGRDKVDRSFYREHFGFPVMDFYRRMGFDFEAPDNAGLYDELVVEFSSAYESRCHGCQLHQGAAAVLEQLHRRQISQSILSASDGNTLAIAVRSFGIAPFFSEIAGLENKHAGGKVAAGHELMNRLQINPGNTLLIGDTVHDFEVASALGTKCLIILDGYNSPERFHDIPAPALPNLNRLQLQSLQGI